MITAYRRTGGDKHNYEYLTYDECRALKPSSRIYIFIPEEERVYLLNVTSIKTWKRTPQIEVHWKYGLYKFGYNTVWPDVTQCNFVREV
jgi:hypothetical protein